MPYARADAWRLVLAAAAVGIGGGMALGLVGALGLGLLSSLLAVLFGMLVGRATVRAVSPDFAPRWAAGLAALAAFAGVALGGPALVDAGLAALGAGVIVLLSPRDEPEDTPPEMPSV
jgi:hypothetical protein